MNELFKDELGVALSLPNPVTVRIINVFLFVFVVVFFVDVVLWNSLADALCISAYTLPLYLVSFHPLTVSGREPRQNLTYVDVRF